MRLSAPLVALCLGVSVYPHASGQSVTVTPASLSFGNQAVGTASAVQKVTLKNGQSNAITFSSISSNLSDYTLTNTCPVSPATLGAGKSCTITGCTTPFENGYLCSSGIAYQQVQNWLLGSSLTYCTSSGTVWTCNLTLADGLAAAMMWDTSQSCSKGVCTTQQQNVPSNFIKYTDLTGASYSIGTTAPVGIKPILFTTQ